MLFKFEETREIQCRKQWKTQKAMSQYFKVTSSEGSVMFAKLSNTVWQMQVCSRLLSKSIPEQIALVLHSTEGYTTYWLLKKNWTSMYFMFFFPLSQMWYSDFKANNILYTVQYRNQKQVTMLTQKLNMLNIFFF